MPSPTLCHRREVTSQHESAPAWAYEPVHVVEPDPRWAVLAQRYIDEVDALLGDQLAGPVPHIGSTAVPGLPAKPIIDLQAVALEPAWSVPDSIDTDLGCQVG